jgi:hypothetical protein
MLQGSAPGAEPAAAASPAIARHMDSASSFVSTLSEMEKCNVKRAGYRYDEGAAAIDGVNLSSSDASA